jgi:phytoene dehydrogenase-like protein
VGVLRAAPSRLSAFYYAVAFGETLRKRLLLREAQGQNLSNSIAGRHRVFRRKILYDTAAEKIVTKDGAVAGVKLSSGKTLPARAVVSNASALTTLREMLPPGSLSPSYLRKLEEYRPAVSMFIVWLGLNKDLKGRFKGYRYPLGSGEGPEVAYRRAMGGRRGEGGGGSHLSTTTSSKGTRNRDIHPSRHLPLRLRAVAQVRERLPRGAERSLHQGEGTMDRHASPKIEKGLIPGLSSMIEAKESATPLPAGVIPAIRTEHLRFEQALNNAYMNRIDNRTPGRAFTLRAPGALRAAATRGR